MSLTPSPLPILISGAGLAGTLLARSLHSHAIPFRLFERDTSPHARAQGYRLRISTDGLSALQAVLSATQYSHFLSGTATTGGGGMHSMDALTGEEERKDEGGKSGGGPGPKLGGDVLGVARGWLRESLLDGMEGKIEWGRRAVGYEVGEGGVRLRLKSTQGVAEEEVEGCMLVICDGARSGLAGKLGEGRIKAFDTGARMIHGQTGRRGFEGLGVGVWSVRDASREEGRLGLITNVRPGEEEKEGVEFGWVFVGGPGTFEPPGGDFAIVGPQAAEMSRKLTSKWHERFQPIFREQNDAEAAFLKMSTAWPKGLPEWKNEPRVTVMGDAVHCMTPAGGVGANTALRDAAFLGRLLGEAGGWKAGITETYEKEMLVYASENVKMSFEAAAKQFGITHLEGHPL